MVKVNRLLRRGVCFLISVYRYLLSPLMRPRCRYYPSCSEYALNAVACYGTMRGLWMASKRMLRCHPWNAGGYDPVPPNDEKMNG